MGKCYVYMHMDGKLPVYVGKGTDSRAWALTGRKNKEHREWMRGQLPELVVVVVQKGLDSSVAHRVENDLINEMKPRYNYIKKGSAFSKAHLAKVRPAPRVKAVVTPNGLYSSLKEAAEAHKVPYSTAVMRVKHNRKGWSYAD